MKHIPGESKENLDKYFMELDKKLNTPPTEKKKVYVEQDLFNQEVNSV